MRQKFKVSSHEAGMTLLAFLRDACNQAPSVKSIKRAIDSKKCTVNGKVETFSTHRLKEGDIIFLELSVSPSQTTKAPLLLWEDEWLRVYDKPAFLVSAPTAFKGHLVHRLDKETTGALLVANSQKALEKMIELFKKKQVRKRYFAIVDGTVKRSEGVCTSRIGAIHRYQGQTVYGVTPKGEEACTEWKRRGTGELATLLECFPITGRTHQIRVHFKSMQHPILGDYQYCQQFKCRYKPERHMLHAYEICFFHPFTEEKMTITSPIPQDFLDALHILGMRHAVDFIDT